MLTLFIATDKQPNWCNEITNETTETTELVAHLWWTASHVDEHKHVYRYLDSDWMDFMSDTQDRIRKLDELFDQACKALSEEVSVTVNLNQMSFLSLEIIDRWLQVREADRQYELQKVEYDARSLTQKMMGRMDK